MSEKDTWSSWKNSHLKTISPVPLSLGHASLLSETELPRGPRSRPGRLPGFLYTQLLCLGGAGGGHGILPLLTPASRVITHWPPQLALDHRTPAFHISNNPSLNSLY